MATPPFIPQNQNMLQLLAKILKQAGGQQQGVLGGNMAPQTGMPTPGRQGQPPPQMMAPPKIDFSTAGAGAMMPPPIPPPAPSPYQTPPNEGMLAKLDPKGAAAYSAVQGISQLIGQFKEKKDSKQQQEAANIAQNLMTAMEKGDTATVYEIMSDPKSMKVLDKVYKGWITKAQDAQKQDKTDPDVQAFEAGIKAYINNKPAPGQPQGGGQGGPQGQPQPAGQPQMPRQIGGRMVPQALPAQLLDAATKNAQLQYAKQDPGSLISGPMTPERQAAMEKLQADQAKAQAAIQVAAVNLQKAQTQAKTAETLFQAAQAKGDVEAEKAAAAQQKALIDLDIKRAQLQNEIQKGKNIQLRGQQQKQKAEQQPPPAELLKMNAIDKAEDLIDQVTARGKGFSMSDIQSLQQELKSAGATSLAQGLPGWTTLWLRGQGTVDEIKGQLDTYKEAHTKMLQERYPAWKGTGSAPDAKDEEPETPEGDDTTEGDSGDEETVIDLTQPN